MQFTTETIESLLNPLVEYSLNSVSDIVI